MVSKSQRQRQLARARWEKQEARRSQRENRRKKRNQGLLAGFIVLLLVGAAAGIGVWINAGEDDLTDLEAAATPTSTACVYTAESAEAALPPATPADPPAMTATLTLNNDPIEIALDPFGAPCTVNALQFLAGKNYYDKTTCHRLTTSESLKVLQCGDPDGTGAGGPGFTMAEENLTAAVYEPGVVAMAKTQAPGSTGSQFFLIYGAAELPAEYTVVGRITSGLDVVEAIADKGVNEGTEEPKSTVVLNDLVLS